MQILYNEDMTSFLDKLFGKLGLNFSFLNRKQSPSNKATLKESSGNTIQQAGRDMYVGSVASPQPRVDLGDKFVTTGSSEGYVVYFNVKNDGDAPAVDVKYYFTADEPQVQSLAPATIAHNLSPGQTSKPLTMFKCSGTDFYTKKLTNPRVVFVYKDRSGKEFRAGRYIQQMPRADSNFNIASEPGDYFEL